jgi:hypothetical protein
VIRCRHPLIGAAGTTIYVATDKDGLARGRNGDATGAPKDPGAILVFHYTGAGKCLADGGVDALSRQGPRQGAVQERRDRGGSLARVGVFVADVSGGVGGKDPPKAPYSSM